METTEIILLRSMTIKYDGKVEGYPVGARVKCYADEARVIVGGGGAKYVGKEEAQPEPKKKDKKR